MSTYAGYSWQSSPLRAREAARRCWLLELIGAARSPDALPVLGIQLDSGEEVLRGWAAAGLKKLDTPEARAQLLRARTNGTIG